MQFRALLIAVFGLSLVGIQTRTEPIAQPLVMVLNQGTDKAGDALWSNIINLINQKSVPFIISSYLWQTFVQARHTFVEQSQKKGTDHYKIVQLFAEQQKNIAHISRIVCREHHDQNTIKKNIADYINARYRNTQPPTKNLDLYVDMMNALVPFNAQDWLVYEIDNSLMLFIPRHGHYNDKSVFNYTDLISIDDPINYHAVSITRKEGNLVRALRRALNAHAPAVWDIYMVGHGWIDPDTIADIKTDEYIHFLNFLQHELPTRTLMYTSCHSGGTLLHTPYKHETQFDTYKFTIIVDNLGSGISNQRYLPIQLADKDYCIIVEQLHFDQTKKIYQLALDTETKCWVHYFQLLNLYYQNKKQDYKYLHLAIHEISDHGPSNLPSLRLAGTTNWILLAPENCLVIDVHATALKKSVNDHFSMICPQTTVCIATAYVPTTINISCRHNKNIVIVPASTHRQFFLKTVDARTMTIGQCLRCFTPLEHCMEPYTWFIETIRCRNKQTWRHIIITCKPDNPMHIYATDCMGYVYVSTTKKLRLKRANPMQVLRYKDRIKTLYKKNKPHKQTFRTILAQVKES